MLELYFAYGSNMSTCRLQARIADASPIGRARLEGWRLACNKRGRDGTGKANVVPAQGARVWGVLFEIPRSEWSTLDRVEWGYQRQPYSVVCDDGRSLQAAAYLANSPGDGLRPQDWYLAHLITGAREHALPEAYIRELEGWESRTPSTTRAK